MVILAEQSTGSRIKATLCIRCGRRYSIQPAPLTRQADSISAMIKKSFAQCQSDYRKVIGTVAKVKPDDLRFNSLQKVRNRIEGNARVTDYPLLAYKDGNKSFDTRACVAICTGKKSTKVWARASLPIGVDGIVTPTTSNCIQSLSLLYREIASKSITWMGSNMAKTVRSCIETPPPVIDTGRHINISTLGVRDKRLSKPFIDLCEQNKTAAEMLADREIDDILTSYYRGMCNLEGMLSEYTNNGTRNIESSSFFKMPVWITLGNGFIEQRMVLFLLRESEKVTEIVGLAYDDSVEMDISIRAGAKLTQIIGFWI